MQIEKKPHWLAHCVHCGEPRHRHSHKDGYCDIYRKASPVFMPDGTSGEEAAERSKKLREKLIHGNTDFGTW